MKKRKDSLILVLVLTLTTYLLAEDRGGNDEVSNSDDVPIDLSRLDFDEEETVSKEDPPIDISHERASVESVVLEVAEKLQLNVYCPSALRQKYVTVRLKNVRWRQVFDLVLSPYKYTYIEKRNIIKIMHNEDLGHYHLSWRIFPLKHRKVSEIAPVIKKITEPFELADFAVDEGQNAFLIYEDVQRFRIFQDIIEKLDKPVRRIETDKQ